MNGKKAKQLRREAERRTVGMETTNYTSRTIQKKKTMLVTNNLGAVVPQELTINYKTKTLHFSCTRSVYQILKKACKQINNNRRRVNVGYSH